MAVVSVMHTPQPSVADLIVARPAPEIPSPCAARVSLDARVSERCIARPPHRLRAAIVLRRAEGDSRRLHDTESFVINYNVGWR